MIIKKELIFNGPEMESRCKDTIHSNEDKNYYILYLEGEDTKYIFETENEAIEHYLTYLDEKESFHRTQMEYYSRLKCKFAESLKKTSQ